jgi:hypothetical protein
MPDHRIQADLAGGTAKFWQREVAPWRNGAYVLPVVPGWLVARKVIDHPATIGGFDEGYSAVV